MTEPMSTDDMRAAVRSLVGSAHVFITDQVIDDVASRLLENRRSPQSIVDALMRLYSSEYVTRL